MHDNVSDGHPGRVVRVLVGVAALLIAMATVAVPPAHAATSQTRGDIVIDEQAGHVFVTAGDSVAVHDLEGNLVRTIPDQGGALDLLLRGRTLYVVAASAHRINAIDADSLTVIGGWSVASAPWPRAMAWSADRIWFTYGHQWSGGLASLDPATGTVTGRLATSLYGQGDIVATESPARVFVFERGLSPSKVRSYDVSTDPPTPLGQSPHTDTCSNGSEVALSADGARLWIACGAPYGFSEFDTASVDAWTLRYQGEPYPVAVDSSADGRFVVGGSRSPYWPDVFVYRIGQVTPLRTFELGTRIDHAHGMLAVSSDGSRIYVVSESGTLHVLKTTPIITSVAPGEVPIRTATEVVIRGTGLATVDHVTIGGHDVRFEVVNDREVRATTPRLRPGRHPVVLTNLFGSNDPADASVIARAPGQLAVKPPTPAGQVRVPPRSSLTPG